MSKEKKPQDIICPVCGYYCLGRGGHGCINKPELCEKHAETCKWVETEGLEGETYYVTQCGQDFVFEVPPTKDVHRFCSHCGRKISGIYTGSPKENE